MSIIADLQNRSLIRDSSGISEIRELLASERVTFYCGFDPTADSLHIGHLLPLLTMRRFQSYGHTPIALVGSATGMIGDPSFKSEERKFLDCETLEYNVKCISKQIASILHCGTNHEIKILGNRDWFGSMNLLTFLRNVGKHFSVNSMLAKDSVKTRIENRDQGISYTEFSYMLLQAYDFYHLHTNYACRLQIGGSDQWGNITEGIDLIRRLTSQKVFGLTFPLLMTSAGKKFGKTEEGSVWLDPIKTSPYKFYQFWMNTADEDVINFLKFFTELDLSSIKELEEISIQKPDERIAQKKLAEYLTTLVHGNEKTESASQASAVLFGDSIQMLKAHDLEELFSDVPSCNICKSEFDSGILVQDIIVQSNLASSKSQARRLISGGGFYVGDRRVGDCNELIKSTELIDGKVLVIRSGRRHYCLIRAV